VDHEERLRKYVGVLPDIALGLMKGVDTPLTIIYPEARNLAPNVIAEDGSVAVRIVKNDFCQEVIRRLNKPIVSTSANISGQPAPLIFKCIPIEVQEQVDHVVNLYQDVLREVKPSTIIKLKSSGEFEIIRK
jgi:L-threonylcarbamoyladenylate synthase